jgi:hypothetical protein
VNENSLIKDIGRSYIVSSLLPAGLFVSLGFLFYGKFINLGLIKSIQQGPFSVFSWIIFSAFIIWVAFALYSTVDYIIQIYEGYLFPIWVQKAVVFLFVLPCHRWRMRNVNKSSQIRYRRPKKNYSIKDHQIILQAQADYFDIESKSPLRENDLLPTRLGNVMRASEIYTVGRYGFEGHVFWTRLATLLPETMRAMLEEKNNHLIFLLNSSLLSFVNAVIAFIIFDSHYLILKYPAIYQTLQAWELQNLFKADFSVFSANAYGLLGLAWLLVSYILYSSSVSVAETFGLLIRSSFDLYRFDLLKQLNHPIPRSLKQERRTWNKLNEFIVNAGNLGNKPLKFNYVLRDNLKNRPG